MSNSYRTVSRVNFPYFLAFVSHLPEMQHMRVFVVLQCACYMCFAEMALIYCTDSRSGSCFSSPASVRSGSGVLFRRVLRPL
uniref:Uncharacterized protein n=1 Tax=Anguilla anguilla TaxID=7936 RepID=A0A0E9XDN4_ANGAN